MYTFAHVYDRNKKLVFVNVRLLFGNMVETKNEDRFDTSKRPVDETKKENRS